jgi:demethylmenaquinone methyltransferase/2-methoxy-6-polyprenyl-1,4-benzoquinol methylase
MSGSAIDPRTGRDPGSSPPNEAWTPDLLAADPHARLDKPERVRAMFTAIAGKYDLNNRLHSFGLDQGWRREVVSWAAVTPETDAVDVACGTGDLTELLADAGARSVLGIDYTPAMLDVARVKTAGKRRPGRAEPTYRTGDATRLELPDASFDVLTIAFGIRNVGDPEAAIREFHRVLRPGGRMLILEFSEPRNPLVRLGNRIYTRHLMPWTATLLAGDRSGAYRYLPKSVATFRTPEELAGLARRAGFADLGLRPLTFGTCTVIRGVRAATPID